MANRVLLSNMDHADLRVVIRAAPDFGHAVNQALVVPTEFEEAQREYPILFRRDVDGEFQSVVLLGLDRGENLFLNESGWQARYLPAAMRRGPFFLGLHEEEELGEVRRELAIYVDLDDPRVGRDEGEPVFLPHGGNAPLLEQVSEALHTVHQGLSLSRPMFALLTELDLIQLAEIRIQFGDGTEYMVPNVHTIGRERLAALDASGLERLHRAGFLAAAIFVSSSLGNVNRLVELKAAKLAQADAVHA